MKHILPFIFILICSTNTAKAQTTISGIVVDELGALPNVNITVYGSKKGTATNNEGYFEIETSKNDVLSMSHIGFETKNVIVNGQRHITVIMEGNVALDEIEIVSFKQNICRSISTTCHTICRACGEEIRLKKETDDYDVLKLYPNPSPKGVFTLVLDKDYEEVKILVYSISGQTILSRAFQNVNGSLRIDLSRYPTGMYIVNTIAEGKALPSKKAIVG